MSKDLDISYSGAGSPNMAMALTGAAFDSAQRAGVTNIEADFDAMAAIAHHLGTIEEANPALLPPLLLVARDTSPGREFLWDNVLPHDQSDPQTSLYYSVNDIGRERPPYGNRDALVREARRMGATALTEISIAGWTDTSTHTRAFGLGLVTGQRPLELPPARSVLEKMAGTAISVFDSRGQGLRRADTMHRRKPPFAPPFIITRSGSEIAVRDT